MYAVIDIGSNTIRLVIYKIVDGKIKPMLNNKVFAGLANYINKENNMKKSGVAKAEDVLKEFSIILSELSIEETFCFATASLRNIDNSKEVLTYLKKSTGFDIQLLSGDEEAEYDYYGALQNLSLESGMLVDVGGGSTELVFYKNKKIVETTSLPVGSLNMYKNYIADIIPSENEINEIEGVIEKQLVNVHICNNDIEFNPVCLVGGTARAILKLLKSRKNAKVNYVDYDYDELLMLLEMVDEDSKKVVNKVLKNSPERIHTFIPGLLIISKVCRFYGCKTIYTSEYGVREGYLQKMLIKRGIINE